MEMHHKIAKRIIKQCGRWDVYAFNLIDWYDANKASALEYFNSFSFTCRLEIINSLNEGQITHKIRELIDILLKQISIITTKDIKKVADFLVNLSASPRWKCARRKFDNETTPANIYKLLESRALEAANNLINKEMPPFEKLFTGSPKEIELQYKAFSADAVIAMACVFLDGDPWEAAKGEVCLMAALLWWASFPQNCCSVLGALHVNIHNAIQPSSDDPSEESIRTRKIIALLQILLKIHKKFQECYPTARELLTHASTINLLRANYTPPLSCVYQPQCQIMYALQDSIKQLLERLFEGTDNERKRLVFSKNFCPEITQWVCPMFIKLCAIKRPTLRKKGEADKTAYLMTYLEYLLPLFSSNEELTFFFKQFQKLYNGLYMERAFIPFLEAQLIHVTTPEKTAKLLAIARSITDYLEGHDGSTDSSIDVDDAREFTSLQDLTNSLTHSLLPDYEDGQGSDQSDEED